MAGGALRRGFDRLLDRRLKGLNAAELPAEDRLDAFMRFGDHSLAYSASVQPLHAWGGRDGFIAYGRLMGQAVALGDPIAPIEARAGLLKSFIAAAGRPSFAEVSPDVARLLAGFGYRATQMGVDTRLDLQRHDFSGGKGKALRYAERWLKTNGFGLGEMEEFPGLDGTVAEMSRRWREGRIVKRREMAFLNRGFPKKPEPLMRRFVLVDPEGRLNCLLFMDPIARDGEVIGYMTSFKRRAPDASAHAEMGLTKFAVERLKEEGREKLMLGLSPLLDLRPSGFPESRAFRALLQALYASDLVNRRVFNVQGHAAFKRRFHGKEEPRYFAWAKGSPLLPFLATLRLSKAF
ncbi:MAG TPA: phosphatidylglycerol lysyltransferase domain-containing protein [Mesorhizobium sp.]|jgi:lysylphosphatidylglycerol synthetase-like protein (DUF2156 family)|nr:phosphatidylglycerol lysyltransferase domain-containing protein [Mesorhizobium sp.]